MIDKKTNGIKNGLEETKITKGEVVDCGMLNVRKEPNINAEILSTLSKGDIVVIDETHISGDFYAITLATGLSGYCMKRYINIL